MVTRFPVLPFFFPKSGASGKGKLQHPPFPRNPTRDLCSIPPPFLSKLHHISLLPLPPEKKPLGNQGIIVVGKDL